MTATNQYMMSDTMTDGMSMTWTVMTEAKNTTLIGIIAITPRTMIEGGMTNEESMQIWIGATQTGRDFGTTGTIIDE